jgi:hypothetical protein
LYFNFFAFSFNSAANRITILFYPYYTSVISLTWPTAKKTEKLGQYDPENRAPQILHPETPAFPGLPVRKTAAFKLIQRSPVLRVARFQPHRFAGM